MSTQQPSEEELRRQLEEEMRRITVDDLLLQTIVSAINLAGRRVGLAPGSEGERDLEQVRTAIDAVTALLPILEHGGAEEELRPIRDALSQLQMAYARLSSGEAPPGAPRSGEGGPAEPAPAGSAPGEGGPGEPGERPARRPEEGPPDQGPAQRSGRLWVPGQ